MCHERWTEFPVATLPSMASLCICTSLLKFIFIKENEYEQYIRSGDNLHVTEGVT